MTYTEKRARKMYNKVQKCPGCGGWYSGYSATPCFACAVNLHPKSNGHHPDL